MTQFAFTSPDEAIDAMSRDLRPVDLEVRCNRPTGRVLAKSIVADRPSPPADVSAMDGYAINASTLQSSSTTQHRVVAESVPGSPPPIRGPEPGVIRIFTGAIIPEGCDRVIRREETTEFRGETNDKMTGSLGSIEFADSVFQSQPGDHIRRCGENLSAGSEALGAGVILGAPQMAAATSFGICELDVFRPIRVGIVTTGDELDDGTSGMELPAWKIRNSNAVALSSWLHGHAWIEPANLHHVVDDPKELESTLSQSIEQNDLVFLTGGVSMGDHDYVPQITRKIGAEIIFHKLPLRPGKPILGAVYSAGGSVRPTPILGLPGNPVSATMGAVRFGMPLLRKLAGIRAWRPSQPAVRIRNMGPKTLPLHWMRAVRLIGGNEAELVIGKGSGDLVSLAQSDGFIEMPPHADTPGPWPYFAW